MRANADKCHVLLRKSNESTAKINEVQIKNSQSEKLLGIPIDNDLKFEDHIITYPEFSYSPFTWVMHSGELNNKINRLHDVYG